MKTLKSMNHRLIYDQTRGSLEKKSHPSRLIKCDDIHHDSKPANYSAKI
jgi:hypothetical protein